ncbi:DUF4936 family protein [Limnobacter humi]|uniref:DUF4936 family protein n=1 Tax=Limnobacter humi TaxID=1778671 RepID=A0ABT1WEJ8_9BURK|nr:DUF4936 family protein [Limnobacter humi]MCQ8895948.1 DUF4936 family protein [Limnobacter humi]
MNVLYTYYRVPSVHDDWCEKAARLLLSQVLLAGAANTRLYRRIEPGKTYTTWMEMVELPAAADVDRWQQRLDQLASLCFASTAYFPQRIHEVFQACA